MSIGWKSLRGLVALTSLSILGSACQQENGLTAPENNPAMARGGITGDGLPGRS